MTRADDIPVFTDFGSGNREVGSATYNGDGTVTMKMHPLVSQRLIRAFRANEIVGIKITNVEREAVTPVFINHIAESLENQVALCNGDPIVRLPEMPGVRVTTKLCDICYRKAIRMSTAPD